MRSVIMTAVWLGIGFVITEFVASYLEMRSVERMAGHKLVDPVREARDLQAAGPATPSP
jgi:hypothetical protein